MWRVAMYTSVAPMAWGTTYAVTDLFLPADRPLFSSVMRALPAGLLLLAGTRRLPRGSWWWKSVVLGICNIGFFFPMIFLAAYRLPGGMASTIQAASPMAVMFAAWCMIGERPGRLRLIGAVLGVAGVSLLVTRASGDIDPVGLAGSFASIACASLGFTLIKRWPAPVGMTTLTAWQLIVGGVVLIPVAWWFEGAPPALEMRNAFGYLWLSLVGTTAAYVCWFRGLSKMPAGAVSLIGLLNPVVGIGVGVVVMGEQFGYVQLVGALLVLVGIIIGQPGVAKALTRRRTSMLAGQRADAAATGAEPGPLNVRVSSR